MQVRETRNPKIAVSQIEGLTGSNTPIPQKEKSRKHSGTEPQVMARGHIESGATNKSKCLFISC
jgi:hypothetical protein